jgi:hypothetical protein
MKVSEFYNEVARKVDTSGTKINVAVTKRVLSVAFQMLGKMSASEFAETVAKAVAASGKKR